MYHHKKEYDALDRPNCESKKEDELEMYALLMIDAVILDALSYLIFLDSFFFMHSG